MAVDDPGQVVAREERWLMALVASDDFMTRRRFTAIHRKWLQSARQ
jgi:hypothetical protein